MRRAPRLVLFVSLLTVTLVVASLYYLTAFRNPCAGNMVIGGPGDPTTGGVWSAWQYKNTSGLGLPIQHWTAWSGAPFGERFWEPHYNTMLLVFSPIWALSHVVSPTCAYNLLLLLGFLLTGLAMFALAFVVTRNPWVSIFASFAYTFSPYRMFKAASHLNYVQAQFVVLVLAASLLVWQRPTRLRIALLALAVAGAAYTDGYYILIGAVGFAAVNALALVWSWFVERRRGAELWTRARAVVLAGVGAAVLMIPLAVTFVTRQTVLSASLLRAPTDVVTFSSRLHYFLMPPRTHPIFARRFGAIQDQHLRPGSNYSEASLYLGYAVLALAVVAMVWVLVSPGMRRQMGLATVALLGTAVIAFVMTLPPENRLGPVAVPAPSKFIFSVVTFFRVYARFFILLHAALVAVAAVGLALLIGRLRWRLQACAVAVAIGVVAFEFMSVPPRSLYDFDDAPSAYRFVARQQKVDVIAEYPLYTWESQLDRDYLTYQIVHGKQLANARITGSVADGVGRALFGLADPDTPAGLRALGVDLVIVHRSLPGAGEGPLPADYELVRSFNSGDGDHGRVPAVLAPYYDVDIYRLRPGPRARVLLREGEGFLPSQAEPSGRRSGRWTRAEARLEVVRMDRNVRSAEVTFTARSAYELRRKLTVTQGGQALWEGEVLSATTVSFSADTARPISIQSRMLPQPVRADVAHAAQSTGVALWLTGMTVRPVA